MRLENTILRQLVTNEEFTRKTLPFIKKEYFSDHVEKQVFTEIETFLLKYNAVPSLESLVIDLNSKKGMSEDIFRGTVEMINKLFEPSDEVNKDWLIEETENWCQSKAIYNSIMESINIYDGKNEEMDRGAIPKLLSDALAVSFDSKVGHDYVEDWEDRFDFYHKKESKVPFDIEYLNTITDGGIPNKTLNVIMAGTGVGKSLFMCHCAAANLNMGQNVLYITLEMSEERIAERIDANLLDTELQDLRDLPRDLYTSKVERLNQLIKGKLIVKEYPTASAHVGHFRHLLNELKIKKNFTPQIIYIDYLNICASSRIRGANASNMYTLVKSIAEEFRGFAVENDLPIVTATQVNRTGFMSSDVDLGDTSESFGLPATADFFLALTSSEELDEKGMIVGKQLKNRYGDLSTNRRFVMGIDRSKMRLYDVEDQSIITQPANSNGSQQEDDTPAFDRGTDNRMTRKSEFGGWTT